MTRRSTSGVIGVDVAVSLATLMLVITAVFDLGNLIAARHTLNFGVFTAARYATVHSGGSTAAITAAITAAFTTAVTPLIGQTGAAHCTVAVSFPSGNIVGGTVVITASYPWTPASLLDGLAHITVTSQHTLTIQH